METPSTAIQAQVRTLNRAFRLWTLKALSERIAELLSDRERSPRLDELPLNNDVTTLSTIEQIDVIWLKGRSIARAFQVEHTTAMAVCPLQPKR